MEKIIEIKGYSGVNFKKYRDNKMIELITVDSFIKEVNGLIYILIIDSYGNLINDAYKYLNIKLTDKSYKKREQSVTALKLLYSFMELYNISNLSEINQDNISRLDEFLQGGFIEGNDYIFNSISIRSNSTINKYYSVYRDYLKYFKLSENIFEEIKYIHYKKLTNVGFLAHGVKTKLFKYETSKVENLLNNVPKFISLVEYNNIINLIKSKYSLREEIIVSLMYEYGMRIGEVLGLTIEDLLGVNYTKDNYGLLIIRNRFSDKHYQNAKGCMKVTSKNIYNKPEYHKVGLGKAFGCEHIKISLDLLSKIENYLYITRSPNNWGSIAYNNLKKKNIADKVTNRSDIKRNSYIFVSKNGTPLCSKAWDNILKKIFSEVNIYIDLNKKEYGLSHKFRHGFAMFKVLIEKYDRLELQKSLRHTNIHSCEVYFSLTETQKSELVKLAYTLQKEGGLDI